MERFLKYKLPNGNFGEVRPHTSRTMQRIKSKGNKTTELKFCQALLQKKIQGFELHSKITGNPDLYFPAYKLTIFLDGCFWHGCRRCGHIPKTNSVYWQAKIHRNIVRDHQKTEKLLQEGYFVLRFWEHEIIEYADACTEKVNNTLENIFSRIINT